MTAWEFNPLPNSSLKKQFFFSFSLFPISSIWALWMSIRHDQSGVNIGLREDTCRETLTMSLCNIRETQIGKYREERRNERAH